MVVIMNNFDTQYINLLRDILENGTNKEDRTGTGTRSVSGRMIQHNMADGFPAITTKKLYFKTMAVELEGFLKGITDKQWYKDRNCNIWNQWSSLKQKPENLTKEELNAWMKNNPDLGPLGYSFQWRNFNGQYKPVPHLYTGFDKTISPEDSDNKYVGREVNGKYGKYTVISYDGDNSSGNPKFTVKFHKSGYVKSGVDMGQINSGKIKDPYFPNVQGVACSGNYDKNLLGEELTEKLLQTWNGMIQRCYNKNHKAYENYGAKGVYVSNSWLIFENYLNDVQQLDNWNKKLENWESYQLDKDLGGGFEYSKEKCIWLTRQENVSLTNQSYYFDAVDPNGILYENQIGLKRFCEEHGLNEKNVQPSMKNNTKTCGGWKFYKKEQYKTQKETCDQINNLLNTLKNNPTSRRMVVSAWNPLQIEDMALPPCHAFFQVIIRGEYLDLTFYMRSSDVFLGLPFNIASYGLLLSLLAHQFGYKPGILTGFLGDTHIYNNHREQVEEQVSRLPQAYELPGLAIFDTFKGVEEFSAQDIDLINYQHCGVIKAPVAV